MDTADLLAAVRTIPDFPRPGIMFRDVTTLFKQGPALASALDLIADRYAGIRVDKVVGVESRGFVLGGALALRLGAGFVPVRKPGKLPAPAIRETYSLEYGTDTVELHTDAIVPGETILMHDDLLATGGTMLASCKLVERLGGRIAGISFIIELPALGGRKCLAPRDVFSLLRFEGE
ncbi:MAG TPA: adenine phosphoribosyltransferase [Bacteroidota bacterium]|nr:adenine phosphoribosyltransferase [Bacteroidota bacterium]